MKSDIKRWLWKCLCIYYNKDDPRSFVYRHQKYKWIGITVNFAHSRARWFFWWSILGLLLIGLAWSVPIVHSKSPSWVLDILMLSCAGGIVWVAFWNTQKDLSKYPGPLADRFDKVD